MGDLNKEDEDEVGFNSVQNDYSTNDSFQLYEVIEYLNRIIFAVLDDIKIFEIHIRVNKDPL